MISFEFQRTGGLVAAPGLTVHAQVDIIDSQTGTVSVDGARVRALSVLENAVLRGALDAIGLELGTGAAGVDPRAGSDQYQYSFGIKCADGRRLYVAGADVPPALVSWAAREADALVASRFGGPRP